jgi:hypothetical protein
VGHAAGESDRREITALINRFYRAAGAGNGAGACPLFTAAMLRSIPEDYGPHAGDRDLHGKTCASVMSEIFKHPPDNLTMADLATTRVIGVRIGSKHGIALIQSKGMPLGEFGVAREGKSWRAAVPIGSVN